MKNHAKAVRYTQVERGHSIRLEQIKLMVTLTLTGCLLLALETTALGRIPLSFLGMGRAAPSLGLIFCMAVGFLHGERMGGGYGLLIGFLADCMDYSREGSGILLLPLIYFLFGYLFGIVGKRRLAHNLPSFAVLAFVGGGIECLLGLARATLQARSLPPLDWIYHALLPVWLLSTLFAPAVYGLLWLEKKLLGLRK